MAARGTSPSASSTAASRRRPYGVVSAETCTADASTSRATSGTTRTGSPYRTTSRPPRRSSSAASVAGEPGPAGVAGAGPQARVDDEEGDGGAVGERRAQGRLVADPEVASEPHHRGHVVQRIGGVSRATTPDLDVTRPTGLGCREEILDRIRRREGTGYVVDLMEYQAKELFAKHGVAGALGKTVETPEDARAAAEEIGGVVVVKAQVKAGGRGKAGGVKVAKTPEEAEEAARAILALEIKGLPVNRVLVVPGASIEEEYYFSFLLDRSNRSYLCIASVEGGVEIEEVAKTNPDAVKKIPIDAGTGVDEAKAPRDRRRGRLPRPRCATRPSTMVQQLWTVFVEEDATLVEVNPLARLTGDKLEALDGKVSLDENAEFRHEDHAQFEIREEADPLEAKAKDKGLNYVKLDGAVGIIGNGAGLVMSTLDVVAYAGEAHGGVKPANFLDIGGGANAAGDGRRPRRDPPRRAGQERVRERLRRHHRLRRGRQRHQGRAGDPRRRGDQAARRTPRRQQRRGGPPRSSTSSTTRW